MFLRPHHFQAAQRHGTHLAHQSEKWDLHYNWGLRSIDIDLDALANRRLVVWSLKARMRDGTLVAVPEDGILPPLDLQGVFERESTIRVFVAVPLFNLGKANAAAGSADGARYLLDTQELEDENTGMNPQPVQVRLLNLKLLLSTQDQAGYEVLPIASIEKAPTAEATPQLYAPYIPPVLACDAWPPLRAGILEEIYDRIGKKVDLLDQQVVSRGITFDSQAQGDPKIFNQLRVVNEAYALLGTLIFAQGLHPLPVYVELSRLVGQLAIFGKDRRRPPDLPKYDHDDLGGCFYSAKKYIDMLLSEIDEPVYQSRPFIGAGLRMQVTLEPAWLEASWQMFVGVQSTMSSEDCIRLLTRAGHQGLDMKIGSSDRVDEIFRLGEPGLKFAHSHRPPRALPQSPGLVYFQVNRESQQQEWARVQKSLTVAVRMNEKLIDGDIQGQRVLRIRSGIQIGTMQLTLYVVPVEK
jgi:type VI secretion system protein ImpJ